MPNGPAVSEPLKAEALSGSAIAGTDVGVIVGLALVLTVAILLYRRRQMVVRAKKMAESNRAVKRPKEEGRKEEQHEWDKLWALAATLFNE
ncbi:hypothetical protein GJ744_004441 [Endocarpon pusillum]|uniref:Uncharacterized protein n=1 Tax=Endocarpon pusillum TaxID=364733 RepID=A0A8H7AW94_9EURO|nr:hypothetical protein GJ744_004441 [Endocarpon pusillum]